MEELCPKCEGSGFRLVERADGTRVAQVCECRIKNRISRVLKQARIPERYAHCTLQDFVPGDNPSLSAALMAALDFVNSYPKGTEGKGLMLVGRPGAGKTHLCVGILRALIAEKKVQGLFVDYRDLLKEIQNSYDPSVAATELGILRPVFEAEVLVLDDLGASKPSDWVFDTVGHILNSRYNDRLTTIITTNFLNFPETSREALAKMNEPQRIMSERTLGDRIGERVLSRLQEMCVVINMKGKDFRTSDPGRASFKHRRYSASDLFALDNSESGYVEHEDIPKADNEESHLRAIDSPTANKNSDEPKGAARLDSPALREMRRTEEKIAQEVARRTALLMNNLISSDEKFEK